MLHSKVSIKQIALMSSDSDAPLPQETEIICHELRNSLAVVRGAARLLPSAPGGEELKTIRSLIERQLDQMSRHIDDLLQPTRRNGHNHQLEMSDVDLRSIARDAVRAIGPELARRRQHLTLKLPDQPSWVHADGTRLEQAISNLLINAAKFTPEGGDIRLTLDDGHQLACVRVRDSGIGIEAAMLPRIFGMFVQVDHTHESPNCGSGIGLAVVKDVVESHGGTVTATSPGLGLGSEFIIVLPKLQT